MRTMKKRRWQRAVVALALAWWCGCALAGDGNMYYAPGIGENATMAPTNGEQNALARIGKDEIVVVNDSGANNAISGETVNIDGGFLLFGAKVTDGMPVDAVLPNRSINVISSFFDNSAAGLDLSFGAGRIGQNGRLFIGNMDDAKSMEISFSSFTVDSGYIGVFARPSPSPTSKTRMTVEADSVDNTRQTYFQTGRAGASVINVQGSANGKPFLSLEQNRVTEIGGGMNTAMIILNNSTLQLTGADSGLDLYRGAMVGTNFGVGRIVIDNLNAQIVNVNAGAILYGDGLGLDVAGNTVNINPGGYFNLGYSTSGSHSFSGTANANAAEFNFAAGSRIGFTALAKTVIRQGSLNNFTATGHIESQSTTLDSALSGEWGISANLIN